MGIKAYGSLLLLTALVVGAWLSLISGNANAVAQYEEHLATARLKAEQGVTSEVLTNYRAALRMTPSIPVASELLDYSQQHQDVDEYQTLLREIVTMFPAEPFAYERLTDSLIGEERYENAFEVFEAAGRNDVSSEHLRDTYAEIRYVHEVGSYAYDDARTFLTGDIAAVYSRGAWQFMEGVGRVRGDRYEDAQSFYGNRATVVVDGVPQFIDRNYDTVLIATQSDYLSFGTLANGMFPAVKPNGQTVYLNTSFDVMFNGTEFDSGSSFANGLAVVGHEGVLKVIDTGGVQVGEDYQAVASGDGGIIYSSERYFAAVSDKFYLYDDEGSRVGTLEVDDARPFNNAGLAAVKVGETWGFTDTAGEIMIEPQFDEARSFANGLAAVRQGDLWGYVAPNGEMAIEFRFEDALDFSESGTTFIKREDPTRVGSGPAWYFLQLIRSKV